MLNMNIKTNCLVYMTRISKYKILKGPNISEFRNLALQKNRAIKDNNYLPQTSLHRSKIIRNLK